MNRSLIAGVGFIVAGIACIFPFIRALVLENIVVMLGIYFIYRGYLSLTTPMPNKKKDEASDTSCTSSCNEKK